MGTRGIIAFGTPEKWRGNYHHWDSYPTGLGATLWDAYHSAFFNKDLALMEKTLVDDHLAGLSSICGADFSKPFGYVSTLPKDLDSPEYEEYQAKPKCYCHGDRSEEPGEPYSYDKDNVSGGNNGFSSWWYTYIIEKTEDGAILHCLLPDSSLPMESYDLNGEEPDWEKVLSDPADAEDEEAITT